MKIKLLTTLCVIALLCSPAFGNATSELFDALEKKDTTVQKVQTLIKFGANVNARQYGLTALMRAAYNNTNPEVVKFLIDAGADVNARVDNAQARGKTALMLSTYSSNPQVVKVLIDAGSDINAQDSIGMTALMHAVTVEAAAEVTKLLINAGADVNLKDENGDTALIYASRALGANSDVIDLLLGAGADVNARDKNGNTALMYAVSKAYP